jgi:ribosomal protein S18 acetylase RimI-like enzyme
MELNGIGNLRFETIDLARHAEEAVAFRRDSYVCSFGSDQAFGSADEYLAWLGDRITLQPAGHVHVWDGTAIIGQLEMRALDSTPVRGYVNLFYLVPEARGRGLGDALHDYFLRFMRGGGAQLARLSVSPDNTRALAYYRKHGWRDLGPRSDDSAVHLMELHVAPM